MNVFLEIKNIKKHFGEGESRVEVLKGIDIEIEKGEFCVLLGPSGSGKSTLLNIIANCLQLKGKEYATSNSFGSVDYCGSFSRECFYTLGEDDYGNTINKLPENSRYIKSEDILYEIKKIQQKQILSDGMEYDYVGFDGCNQNFR